MKTILLSVDNFDRLDDLLSVTAAIASSHESHVIGLHVTAGPAILSPDYGPSVLLHEYHHDKKVDDERQLSRSKFETLMRDKGVSFEWREVRAETPVTAPVIIAHSREADVVILGLDAPDSHGEVFVTIQIADIILKSGRPVVIVPALLDKVFKINTAVIGWNNSREATRAAFDSAPMLKFAENVYVLAVNSKLQIYRRKIASHFCIKESLARHGLNIETHTINKHAETGLAIIDFAKSRDADILVVGAYGRSRISERLFGGTTEYLLRHASLPMLLAH